MSNRYGNGRGNWNGGGRRSFGPSRGGPRHIKSFDPTRFINTPKEEVEVVSYKTVNSFNDFEISSQLKENIKRRGYDSPTPIQDQAIIPLLSGRDLIGIANTGTGKTAAFLIPLIEKVEQDSYQRVLILTPTRELAVQIKDEFRMLSDRLSARCVLCIGGAGMRQQRNDLSRRPAFVIGTPGRIQDHIRNGNINLSEFGSVVLDEADRMVDIGFIHEIKSIIALLPRVRQSLFFSATISGKVQDILRSFVHNPITVSVKTQETAVNVAQKVIRVVDRSRKIDQLLDLLKESDFSKVLVFGRTKHGVQRISDELSARGVRAGAIHGNKRQNQRTKVLDNFKRNNLRVLIATDVASRGIDIPNVSHVINYDLPESFEAYIHRIGRTGRADKKGIAITFVD